MCNLQIFVAHNIEYDMLFVVATQLQTTCGAVQYPAMIGIGALIGTAVGSLLTAFILLGIPRSVLVKYWLATPYMLFHKI